MYLSRVEIDIKNRKKIKDLSHVGAIHNWVEGCFPEEFNEGVRTRKLWRIDSLNGKDYLLIVSVESPSIEHLEKYGVPGTGQVKNYDKFLNNIEEGKRYTFCITLNPVVSKMVDPNEKRGRVKPVVNDEQMKFLYDRSEKNGFRLNKDEFFVANRGYVTFNRSSQKQIKLSKATYEGKLIVIDKEKFIETLTKGLGKKKAYGFGMMTVIPEV